MPKSYYPPEPLKRAQIIPKTIFEKNAGNPIFRVTLAEELKFKSGSRTFRDLITASAGYGLTSGSYISEKITLEPTGTDLACGKTEPVYNALFSLEVFKKFYDNFGSGGSRGIPSEKAARDFLQNECGVPEGQSKGVLEHIIQDAKDWFLIQDIAGGDKFVPVDLAKEKAEASKESMEEIVPKITDRLEAPVKKIYQEPIRTKPSLDISPRLQLNIEIHIAADTSDEKIETIFKNMRKYLLSDGE
ncbi:MAG: hypothetical protein AB1345_14195 [Chloroflexota bacterium]